MDAFEEKYSSLIEANKDYWYDLHFRRGAGEIDDKVFSEELQKLGVTEGDVASYIEMLNMVNTMAGDIMDGFNMEAMTDILLKYERLSDLESQILEMLKVKNESSVREILKDDLNMEDSEIETVVSHYNFQIQMDQKFNSD